MAGVMFHKYSRCFASAFVCAAISISINFPVLASPQSSNEKAGKVVVSDGHRTLWAEEFITVKGDVALGVIAEKNYAQKCVGVSNLVDEIFDINVMERVALARFSKKASDEELMEYHALFRDYIFYSFFGRDIVEGVDEFRVIGSAGVSEKDTLVYATAKLADELEEASGKETVKDELVNMEFRVRRIEGEQPRIINVKVMGFDLVSALRNEIRELINSASGDFEEFLFDFGEKILHLKDGNNCSQYL